ncbi:MAG: hypothetical protein Q7U98_02885 [Methylicorpusculum sp.]|uniref:hypothetical protein n=1 Tax=Methylicorpusculum sp. TaxID=2713644 RepID=UPI00271D1291|nr:hypothetical protein [Methylicorpusculum sp.]MDO8845261.1 hypothetical protein [Methylicorpusculum sp.]MDO8938086.1 hypothetical protein [Methylicorpusculum sp.]MDP2178913.1 hypothetical protein [Methylicorpusculum sp.]MDP3530298.1 hypothetical protein [Methylicorpusculum sp.]MDZ4153948.1 hypothetical protein [Methylicorpusculum sp.]
MPQSDSVASIIPARIAVIGTAEFQQLELTAEEIRIYLTVTDRLNWPASRQHHVPDFASFGVDEEEL